VTDLPWPGPDIVARWRAGEISPEIAVAQLVLAGGDERLPEQLKAAGADELAAFAEGRRAQLSELARLVADGIEPENESLEATRALFDRLAARAPDPAVAIYALNDPDTLARATDELVRVVDDWAGLDGRRVLDFGCGTGRVAAALGGRAASVLGIDLSPGMIAEARRRHGQNARLAFRALGPERLAGAGPFDLVLAIDCFPFIVRAGADVLARSFADLFNVLAPGGDLMVFNWSYRGDHGADLDDALRLADAHGLDLARAGERPFAIWDGIGFHFRRTM